MSHDGVPARQDVTLHAYRGEGLPRRLLEDGLRTLVHVCYKVLS